MAAQSEMRNRFNNGKELPPITLSNTNISSLVSLIPVLVALTSSARKPCFDNENDKPVWWPDDIQWKNPKHYSTYMGDNILKILRKVVHSCYSYHGVEDLLCRLDDTPLSESEVVDISDDGADKESNVSADNDGPVFVCCFCLEEFNSHEKVSVHQRLCRDKSQDAEVLTEEDLSDIQLVSETLTGLNDSLLPEFPRPVSLSTVSVSESCLQYQSSSNSNSTVNGKAIGASTAPSNAVKKYTSSSSKRQPANKVVPILKTRSQKKLDQIMDRHNKKQLMFKECRELLEVPKTGAWWVRKQRQRTINTNSSAAYPNKLFTKNDFLSNLGLTLKLEVESQQNESDKIEVDLDCEIICVEGPLSSKPCPTPQENSNALSPRGSRSLMSQLARDESNSRRRISFCFVEDEWADKEALEEGRDPLQMSLLTLDLSSPLGQRIKKYVNADGQMNVVKDVELYCKTDTRDENKLRVRACDFKVTFRKKCRASSYVHTYKFNQSDVREFKRRLLTGLSSRSRGIQKKLPNSKLVLKKITDKDIELFNAEKKVTIAKNIMVDDDLCITQIDVPQSLIQSHKNRLNTPTSTFCSTSSHPLRQQQPSHSFHPSHPHQARRPHPYPVPQHLRHRLPPGTKRGIPLRPFSLSHRSNHSPSPPHIPNIFRNRANSNTPSPPRPIPNPRVDAWRHSQSDFKRALMNLQDHQQPSHNQHPHHFHQQQRNSCSSPPLGFSSGVIISERRPVITNSNRRKQLMNQLRHDDLMDKNSSRKDEARNFVNLADASSKYKNSPSSSSQSSSSLASQQSQRPQDSSLENTHSKPQDLSKLSNFEYFSIKQGKLLPGHSMSPSSSHRNSPTIKQDKMRSGEAMSHYSCPQQSKTIPPQGNSTNPYQRISTIQSPRYPTVPSARSSTISHARKSIPSPSQRNSPIVSQKSSIVPPQRDSTIPSPGNYQQRPVMKPDLSGHHQRREVIRQGPRQPCASSMSRPSPLVKPNSGPVWSVDDDVMEVICIDD